jgi:hypothetical protein
MLDSLTPETAPLMHPRLQRIAAIALILAATTTALAARPVIMITGYWPPTNEMLRPWSTSASQNPGGWVGSNWEGRGYDVKAYFPEFPSGVGRGVGDFEVDYQDTVADWARITADTQPIAIVTFSRANTTMGWELEPAYMRWRVASSEANPPGRTVALYSADYSTGGEPTRPTDPVFIAEPIGNFRYSNLPMQTIVNNVGAAIPSAQISPFIDTFNPASTSTSAFSGNYLSGFIGYHGAWYRDTHSTLGSVDRCYFGGHIHVGMNLATAVGTQAVQITLRALIDQLDAARPPCPCDFDRSGGGDSDDLFIFLDEWFTQNGSTGTGHSADIDGSSAVDGDDLFAFLDCWFPLNGALCPR